MSILAKRMEKGSCRKDIRLEGAKLPRQVLEDLIFCDYLDYLKYLIVQIEKPHEKVGTFNEFYNNDCLTSEQIRKRKRNSFWQGNRKRRKLIEKMGTKVDLPNADQNQTLEAPLLEAVDDEADWMEWQEPKNFLKDMEL